MFIVFDLDGTLALLQHRLHFIERPRGEKDWEGFNQACIFDSPNIPILATMKVLCLTNDVEIWTGRDEAVRGATERWLGDHGGEWGSNTMLRMRPTGDHTHDDEMKRQWMDEFGVPDLVFEDRSRVVDMWRRHGVTCCQVAKGDF